MKDFDRNVRSSKKFCFVSLILTNFDSIENNDLPKRHTHTLSLSLSESQGFTGLTHRFFHFSCFLFLIAFGVNVSTAQEAEIGKRAPNLRGFNVIDGSRINLYRLMTETRLKKDTNGNPVKKANGKFANEYIHYVTVLNFFAKTCIPCLREIPTFNRIEKKFREQNVKFLYVNVDPFLPEAKAKDLMRRYQIEVTMMLVNQNEAIRKYGAQVLPRLVIIDKKKKVSHTITGFNDDLKVKLTKIINELL